MESIEPKTGHYVVLGPIGTIVVGVLAIAVGVFLAWIFGYASFTAGAASESWPSVEGKITASKISESGPHDNRTLRAHVSYQYEVNENIHRSDRVDFNSAGMSSSQRGDIQEITRKYPVGRSVTVYYDPDDPNISVLEPGVKLGAAFMLGMICIGVGGVVLLSGVLAALRRPKTETPH